MRHASSRCAPRSTPAPTSSCSTTCRRRRWRECVTLVDGRAITRGVGRREPRHRARDRRDGRGLDLGRRAHALGAGDGPRARLRVGGMASGRDDGTPLWEVELARRSGRRWRAPCAPTSAWSGWAARGFPACVSCGGSARRVVGLDAGRVGWGAAGRNGGLPPRRPRALLSRRGRTLRPRARASALRAHACEELDRIASGDARRRVAPRLAAHRRVVRGARGLRAPARRRCAPTGFPSSPTTATRAAACSSRAMAPSSRSCAAARSPRKRSTPARMLHERSRVTHIEAWECAPNAARCTATS